MAELTSLIAKRGTLKAHLTRFNKVVDSFNISETSIIELKKRLHKIEHTCFADYDAIQTQIEFLDALQAGDRIEFENNYFSIVSRAEQVVLANIGKPLDSGGSSSSSESLDVVQNSKLNSVRLPTIKLPSFQGLFDNWMEFHDIFDSLINKNLQINEVQKLLYLKSCVTGEAARVIGSLETTASNYTIAWQLLCDRFANKRLLIHNHIKALFNLQKINKESSSELRSLIDNLNKNLRSLDSLGQSVQDWDPLLIHMVTTKLDPATSREWEAEAYKSTDSPSLDLFFIFLKNKASLLEAIEIRSKESITNELHSRDKSYPNKATQQKIFFATNESCSYCKQLHKIYNCFKFRKMSTDARIQHVKDAHLCMNCLHSGHSLNDCRFGTCKRCPSKHHTLLHSEVPFETSENASVALSSFNNSKGHTHTLLSTAIIKVFNNQGKALDCRVLLDSASESSFITEGLCKSLGLKKGTLNISIVGIGQVSSLVKYKCDVKIQSKHGGFSSTLSCLVIPSICERMPTQNIDIASLNIPNGILLADPQFHRSAPIDMLIGVDLFWSLLCIGQITLGPSLPILQKNKFGWIISGPINTSLSDSGQSHCHFTRPSDVQDQIAKFWDVEEIQSPKRVFSKEELDFENHFVSTMNIHTDGKFVFNIPFKDNFDLLGDSYEYAKKRFYNLERKLKSNSDLRERYIKFMDEYEELGHMSKVSNSEVPSQIDYFLPHHGVLKEDSLTTKLRVVFDGSHPTSSGVSLNQIQMSGGTLQSDIFSILIRFRSFSYVVSADVEKMYRCIWVATEQRSLQQILWRKCPAQPLNAYKLNTVTYGTTNASFLAIRCLHQLSIENNGKYPLASQAIANSFYVDDFLHGSDSQHVISQTSLEVSNILRHAGFHLRKWVSNKPEILKDVTNSTTFTKLMQLGSVENSKTLGIFWSSTTDMLSFKIASPDTSKPTTKRAILSGISQIYDPLGLLSACIIVVKIMLQKLWLERLNWDESVSLDLHTKWVKFRKEIVHLNYVQLPRHVICKEGIRTELHGFCDASQDAYAACIYIRSRNMQGEIIVQLLCAKSKVAPLKVLTVPRLELQGALMLSRLADKVCNSLSINFDKIFFWCDSTIVLAWLRTSLNLLKTFVANRVCEIQTVSDISKWRHIRSYDNPADLASRGVNPHSLINCELWWNGPNWLSQDTDNWPTPTDLSFQELHEMKNTKVSLITYGDFQFPFERFTKYLILIRSIACILRFAHNCRNRHNLRKCGPVTTVEMHSATIAIVKLIQHQHFAREYTLLSQGRQLHKKVRCSV